MGTALSHTRSRRSTRPTSAATAAFVSPERSGGCSVPPVHVTVTRVRTGDQPIANATIVAEEMYRWFRDIEGFEGFLMLSREGTTLSMTFWQNSELAEKSRTTRESFRERIIAVAGVEVEDVEDYRLMFGRLPALES